MSEIARTTDCKINRHREREAEIDGDRRKEMERDGDTEDVAKEKYSKRLHRDV